MAQVVELKALFDELKLGRFHLVIVALCFATLFIDGMDFAAIVVAAPAILRAWQIPQSAMGIVFGAGNFGLLIGAILFGMIGDRYGRRIGLIAGVLTYSVPALATGFAQGLGALLALRFLTTLGIGGVLPNAIAFLTESAPRRYRASFVIVALIGTSLGAAAAGGVAATAIPSFGWQAVFFIVGGLGVLLGATLYAALGESIPFLALKDSASPELRRRVAAAVPGLRLEAEMRFTVERPQRQRVRLGMLFQGPLKSATPLLWGAYFAEALTFITLITWTPVLLEAGGLTPAMASLAFGYGAASGVVTRLLISRALDRYGALAVFGCAAAALAGFVYLGAATLAPAMMIAAMVFATAFATAAHDGLNAIVGGFYPIEIRANGVGWASGAGRLAAIAGPVAAGYMLSANLSFATMIFAVGAPYLLLALFCLLLNRCVLAPAAEAAGSPAPAKP